MKTLLAVLSIAAIGYGIHRHAAAREARQREANRASSVWVDLIAFRIVPAWFDAHPGTTCRAAAASLASENRRDSWGRHYQFSCVDRQHAVGQRLLVRSAGLDGMFDTDDDVWSYALGSR